MPYIEFSSDVDVDVDEFLSACSNREREELIDALVEDGYVIRAVGDNNNDKNLLELEWDEMITKLWKLRQRITLEEEEIIKNIIKKY
jgi:hypothetical protein